MRPTKGDIIICAPSEHRWLSHAYPGTRSVNVNSPFKMQGYRPEGYTFITDRASRMEGSAQACQVARRNAQKCGKDWRVYSLPDRLATPILGGDVA